ncbi:MAG: AgmX/PglI C-terminal domain-containing protein [Nitrospirota bacterium]
MNCKEVLPSLSDFIDGFLTKKEEAKVKKHLATCENCQREVSSLKDYQAGMNSLGTIDPPDSFLDSINKKIDTVLLKQKNNSIDNPMDKINELPAYGFNRQTEPVVKKDVSAFYSELTTRSVVEIVEMWHDYILSINHISEIRTITIGENPACSYLIPSSRIVSPDNGDLIIDSFPFIRPQGSLFILSFTDSMDGEILRDGELLTFETIKNDPKKSNRINEMIHLPHSNMADSSQFYTRYEYHLAKNETIKITLGEFSFHLKITHPARQSKEPLLKRTDLTLIPFLITVILFFGVFYTYLATLPADTIKAETNIFDEDRFASLILKETRKSAFAKMLMKKEAQGLEGEGKKMSGDEGKAGKKNGNKDDPTRPGLTEDRKYEINSSGVLGAFKGDKEKAALLDNLLGTGGGYGTEIDSALIGTRYGGGGRVAMGQGIGGQGLKGIGKGGGGTGVGIGGLGTKGIGGGISGYGKGSIGEKRDRLLTIQAEEIEEEGGLTRDIIMKYVSRYIRQIRYCYEKELQKTPHLNGKIVIKWTITPDGKVKNPTLISSSMNNGIVEGCIMRTIKLIRFPQPKGGGDVTVKFPFIFNPV